MNIPPAHIKLSPEIAAEIAMSEAETKGKIVALESTVFSYLGLPMPERQKALEQAKAAIRKEGATPAVTALFDGDFYVGLTDEQESMLLNSESARKMSLRDMAIASATQWEVGVTTVSATLALAHSVGIKIMATGGIGGAHRESESDVSADLHALSRYPVGVVCAGVKGFLDLPRTMEILETLGVPVVGYQTDDFPAFWCQRFHLDFADGPSLKVPFRLDTPDTVAELIAELPKYGTSAGAVIAQPISSEFALEEASIERAIDKVLKKSSQKKGKGKSPQGSNVTPFFLQEINEATAGKTLGANLALLESNASLAGKIACLL